MLGTGWVSKVTLVVGMVLGVATGAATATTLAFSLPAAAAAPCSLQSYPPAQVGVQLSTDTAVPGQTITVTGSGFAPNSTVVIELGSPAIVLGQVTTNGQCEFRADVLIPANTRSGTYRIVVTGRCASGLTCSLTLSALITITSPEGTTVTSNPGGGLAGTVAPPSASTRGPLAFTGAESLATVLASLALIVVGTAAVLAARRRRGLGDWRSRVNPPRST